MKKNIYIPLILLLSFSLGVAQGHTENNKIESNKVISVSVNDEAHLEITADHTIEIVKEKDTLLIDPTELKESISKTSDIRLYLNRVRNVENIKMIFPKINKPVKV